MRRPLVFEHISMAYDSLRATRSRTLLTVLGVTIGVASVTTILALSFGVSRIISHQVESIGGNIAVVRPRLPEHGTSSLSDYVVQQSFSTSTLTEKDYAAIASIPGVEAAAPIMTITGSPKTKLASLKSNVVFATTPSFLQTVNLPLREGQFIDSITNINTAVIGGQLAVDLFGTEVPIGQTFELRGQTFTVIGILQRTNDPVNYNNVDFDRAIILSLESGKLFNNGISQLQQINIRAKDNDSLGRIVQATDTILAKNHSGEQDYIILHGSQVADPTSQLFRSVAGVLTAIAAISLVVGGIGIMNIMLVGVAERTREIGLRKAVGASNTNIVSQFMTESLIISLVGGLAGVAVGYLAALIASTFFAFRPAFTWWIVAIGIGIALIVGLVFGLYPAIRAARKNPIESLRQYH